MWCPAVSREPAALKQWVSVQRPLVPRDKAHSSDKKHQVAFKTKSQDGYLKVLDKALVLDSQERTEGTDARLDLEAVVRIDVRGSHVYKLGEEALLSCVRLRICNLSDCHVQDLGAFYGSINLLKLDLSNNQISRLPPDDFWSSLISLRVLYLNGNVLSEQADLQRLNGCRQLHVLTLHNTPLALTKNYRHHAVNSIFSLKALDHHVVSDQEIIENMLLTDKFKPLTRCFKLPLHITVKPGTGVMEELHVIFRLLLAVDRVLAKHSPVLLLQRWIRGWLVRRALLRTATFKIRDLVVRSLRKLASHQPPVFQKPLLVLTPPAHPPPPPPQHQQDVGLLGPPCPPQTPMETYVLGVDSDTNKLFYNMQINLGRLQWSVDKSVEGVELRGVAHGGAGRMRNARREKMVHLHVPGLSKKGAVQDTGIRTELGVSKKGAFQDAGIRTELGVNKKGAVQDAGIRTELGVSKKGAVRDAGVSKKGAVQDTGIRTELSVSKKGAVQDISSRTSVSKRGTELVGLLDDEDVTHVMEDGDDLEGVSGPVDDTNMSLSGLTLSVLPHEDIPQLVTSKRENVKMIREAEKEMCQSRLQVRQAPAKHASKSDAMTKDEFVFTRVYGTMNLGLLRKMDQVHHTRKAREELEGKTNLVARVRRERVMRRGKIEAFQNHLKDRVRVWKCREEGRLEQRKEALDKEREEELVGLSRQREVGRRSAQKQQEERELSDCFRQNSAVISNTLCTEDSKVSEEQSSAAVREKVRQVRQESLEQQEEARKYLEQRRNRLWEEGRQEKQDIDAKMLELASQRLMEGKQRIAKEAVRKETARAAIAMAKEELRTCPRGLLQCAQGGPVIHTDRSKGSCPPPFSWRKSAEFKDQTGPGLQQYHTWQRGMKAVASHKQFPMLHRDAKTPLMYDMMVPHLRSKHVDTPFTELESSTNSLHTPLQMQST